MIVINAMNCDRLYTPQDAKKRANNLLIKLRGVLIYNSYSVNIGVCMCVTVIHEMAYWQFV